MRLLAETGIPPWPPLVLVSAPAREATTISRPTFSAGSGMELIGDQLLFLGALPTFLSMSFIRCSNCFRAMSHVLSLSGTAQCPFSLQVF